MSDLEAMFAAKAGERMQFGGRDPELQKITIKVNQEDVRVADFIANELGMTRQEVVAATIHEGLFDAFKGVAFGLGFDEGEREAKWRELTEEAEQ